MDYQNKHVSKYTIIIYLTNGRHKDHILKIDDYCLKEINYERFNCHQVVIFDQKYEHEGNPYETGDKIFIRSELIYYKPYMNCNEDVAKLFNMSCYMVKQSMFNTEIKKYVNDAFNHTNKLRHYIENDCVEKPYIPYYHKICNNINYVTNGNDYYFCGDDIKNYAMCVIFDYFNVIHDNTNYSNITSKVIDVNDININSYWADISKYILENSKNVNQNTSSNHDIGSYMNKISNNMFVEEDEYLDSYEKEYKYPEGDNDCSCCGEFNVHEHYYICKTVYTKNECEINDMKSEYSAIIMGNKIEINVDDIKVLHDKIIFKNTGIYDRVNFASCYGHEVDEEDYYITKKEKVIGFKLPIIKYKQMDGCVCLSIDMFNNGVTMTEDIFVDITQINKSGTDKQDSGFKI